MELGIRQMSIMGSSVDLAVREQGGGGYGTAECVLIMLVSGLRQEPVVRKQW